MVVCVFSAAADAFFLKALLSSATMVLLHLRLLWIEKLLLTLVERKTGVAQKPSYYLMKGWWNFNPPSCQHKWWQSCNSVPRLCENLKIQLTSATAPMFINWKFFTRYIGGKLHNFSCSRSLKLHKKFLTPCLWTLELLALALGAFSFINVTDHSVLLNLCGQHMLGEHGFFPSGYLMCISL